MLHVKQHVLQLVLLSATSNVIKCLTDEICKVKILYKYPQNRQFVRFNLIKPKCYKLSNKIKAVKFKV